jgi:hypothetical protein
VAKVPSRLFVIDASIAKAAGDTSMHPTSKNCREFLESVRGICHRMVQTDLIREEWKKHQSRFARMWCLSMMKRKKIESVKVAPSYSLVERLEDARLDSSVLAAIDKDRHLLEAALATDKRVASLDEKVRFHLQEHASKLPEVLSICWVNPSMADEECIPWLKSGAPAAKGRMIGNASR